MMTSIPAGKGLWPRPNWLSREVWPFEIRKTTAGDTPLAYTDEGSGPTLLFVHDGMWSFVWGQLMRRLAGRFRVITCDFPGAGLSPADGASGGLGADSALLEAFVDRLGLQRMIIVAHDLGGPVGAGLATRRPDAIDGFVFVNTFAWPPRARLLRAMLGLMSSAPMAALNGSTNVLAALTSSRFGVGRNLDREARAAFVAPYREDPTKRRRFHRLMGSVLRETEFLSEIERLLPAALAGKPVLTVFGERNDPFGFQRRFRETFPWTEQMVLRGGNHFPMCDAPDEVAARIASTALG